MTVEPRKLAAAAPAAWVQYEVLVEAGAGHPWHALMQTLLAGAGISDPTSHVDWLWSQQPTRNLWRAPVVPMVALARELAAAGANVGIVSNSEGRLAELLTEIGIADPFTVIIDSGRVGVEKPDPRIFAYALAELGAGADLPPIHIGDLWNADIQGALGAAGNWRAIWYGKHAKRVDEPRVASAASVDAVRAALIEWGALPR